jgi:hypothetical protein
VAAAAMKSASCRMSAGSWTMDTREAPSLLGRERVATIAACAAQAIGPMRRAPDFGTGSVRGRSG